VKPDTDTDPDPIWIQSRSRVLITKNLRKKIQMKKIVLIKNYNLLMSKQATGEDFSPEKRTSSTSKNGIY
jgi:hypothetical protein